jgi:hypothetical protein
MGMHRAEKRERNVFPAWPSILQDFPHGALGFDEIRIKI